MEYISTRNNSDHFSFKNVFLKGLADDGGLFVPKSIKPFSKDELNKLSSLNYNELATEIIFPFIGDFMTKEELISTVSKSYSNFRAEDVVKISAFALDPQQSYCSEYSQHRCYTIHPFCVMEGPSFDTHQHTF